MKKTIYTSDGFTLVEMLAVTLIFISIGSIIVSILITSLRTSHKADTVSAVKENGNYTLTQVAKTLRDARALITPFPCVTPVVASTITVATPANDQVTYTCTGSTIASNGASLLDTNVVSLQNCSFTCMQDYKSGLPIIAISFSLKQKSTSTFAEQIASLSAVPFQTSIVIRNINR